MGGLIVVFEVGILTVVWVVFYLLEDCRVWGFGFYFYTGLGKFVFEVILDLELLLGAVILLLLELLLIICAYIFKISNFFLNEIINLKHRISYISNII